MRQQIATTCNKLQHPATPIEDESSSGLYHPNNEVTDCNNMQQIAIHIRDTASYASSPPCNLYVYVYDVCVRTVYVCVSKDTPMKVWHFLKKKKIVWCYGSVCCLVAVCWRKLLPKITILSWCGCGVTTMSRLPWISRLFCKRVLQKWRSFEKETLQFREPTNHCHHSIRRLD